MITQERGFGLYAIKNCKEIKLAMQSLWLTGQIHTFGARLLISHVLQSSETEPIEAVYSFMLPKDGTLRRFYITGEGFSAHSELKSTQEAEKNYEEGIEAGHLSVFSKIYGDGIVNLNIGNIKPKETITVHLEIIAGVESHHNGFRFRFPFTLAPSYHAQAKMVELADGQGEIELPEEKFGDIILPAFMKDSNNLHKIGFNLNISYPQDSIEIASPSHTIQTRSISSSLSKVSLSIQNDIPNRDLVIDVHSKKPEAQFHQGEDITGQTSFICTIPAPAFGKASQEPRNFVFLLDRSGSMQGAPMQQAKNALRACTSALAESDTFSLIAFDDKVEVFDSMVEGTMENRRRLEKFLEGIEARGGTELMHGIQTASSILGDHQGDIMVITDGQVFGGEEIMQHAKALSLRLHILGIGAASQDRFISSLARETGGISKFVTPRERIDTAALELFSGIGRPVATDIHVSLAGTKKGCIEPDVPAQIFESSSLQVFGHCNKVDNPQLVVTWTNDGKENEIKYSIESGYNCNGNTLRLIRGARLITDYENMLDGSIVQHSAGRRQNKRAKEKLATLSGQYDLSSREMALVAVIEREGDEAGKLPKTTVVPVGMPQDVEFDSCFMLSASQRLLSKPSMPARFCDKIMFDNHEDLSMSRFQKICPEPESTEISKEYTEEDLMVDLAAMIESDGGIPGDSIENRILASLIVLLYFYQNENTPEVGAFRVHVKRLITFLIDSMDRCPQKYSEYLYGFISKIEDGNPPQKFLPCYTLKIQNRQFVATEEIWNEVCGVPNQ